VEITVLDKPVALVTGANKGIGLQIAKELVAHGLTVLVGSRDLRHGETAAKSLGANARAINSTSQIRPQSPPQLTASGRNTAVSTCS
jgi:NAD(P)-dependent dehydrogenase (short-subunit alcohol dehydrogenase family)